MFLLSPGKVDTMLRRKPTRLELKIDDTEEFENVKKELEVSVQRASDHLVWFQRGWSRSRRWMECFGKHFENDNTAILNSQLYFSPLFVQTKAKKRQREEAESGGSVGGASVIGVDMMGGGASASASSSTSTSRAEHINERIGYKPHPKPATLPTLFGSLQF